MFRFSMTQERMSDDQQSPYFESQPLHDRPALPQSLPWPRRKGGYPRLERPIMRLFLGVCMSLIGLGRLIFTGTITPEPTSPALVITIGPVETVMHVLEADVVHPGTTRIGPTAAIRTAPSAPTAAIKRNVERFQAKAWTPVFATPAPTAAIRRNE